MKLNLKKTALVLLLTSSFVVNRSGLKIQEVKADTFSDGEMVRAVETVNMRLGNNRDMERIGSIPENAEAEKILSCDNNWDLVRYKNTIGYVCRDYLKTYSDRDALNTKETHREYDDVVYATSDVNLRLEPNTDCKVIGSIKKGCEAQAIAKTNDGWYLVSYNGKIGYVSQKYTISLLDYIKQTYPDMNIKEIGVPKIVYATSDLNIRNGNSTDYDKIGMLDRYESCKVLAEVNGWYLVITNDKTLGFVSKQYTKELKDTYVVIDLSNQELCLYRNNELILKTSVTTGKNSTPTNVGLFKIYSKEEDRYLTGDGYRSYVDYWMPFDGGIGLHDASWRSKFGGDIYIKNGSHGCVNIPPKIAAQIYEQVDVGTSVLVHK